MTAAPKPPIITVDTKQQILMQGDIPLYSIRRDEWHRIRRSIEECKSVGSNKYSNASWGFVGIATSALFAIVSLYSVDTPTPAWVHALCWAFLGTFGVLALAFYKMASDIQARANRDIDHVVKDMNDLESLFTGATAAPDPTPPATPTSGPPAPPAPTTPSSPRSPQQPSQAQHYASVEAAVRSLHETQNDRAEKVFEQLLSTDAATAHTRAVKDALQALGNPLSTAEEAMRKVNLHPDIERALGRKPSGSKGDK